jgi:threonyl-tRNA synthetase
MLHHVVYGSLERFIGVLLEHLNGNLPLWLSPIQVRVINFTDRNLKACEKLMKELKEALPMIRIDSDFRSTTVSDKIRDASLQKIPFIILLGDKEKKNKRLAVRTRDGKVRYNVKIEDFIEEVKKLIEERN